MATTTNYGWTTPDDTSLVKDGASAIRSLGTAIDTSLNTALGTRKAGLVLLNTTSFSGVASQSINDVFSATYDNYFIVINHTGSADQGLDFRFRVSGADNTTTNYDSVQIAGTGGAASSVTNAGQNYMARFGNTGTTRATTTAYIFDPFNTQLTTFESRTNGYISGGVLSMKLGSGRFNATTSFTGFTIYVAGTFTGTVSVYGVNK